MVLYAGCPVVWSSKLFTEIALSSTKSEYTILNQAAREVLGVMGLMKEVKERRRRCVQQRLILSQLSDALYSRTTKVPYSIGKAIRTETKDKAHQYQDALVPLSCGKDAAAHQIN